ncbi:mono-functional DNA-alkylating methyl methanesulfonate N-term-domain-containing protein [Talaromyces proteolyticus]|uniref:Mono-functional DNA-alkylating methyl methanesulfonate N-term-domain-containing protein n=1 Tax=Talaromyces proteolyticus TaxID=1131652 RepID=A0AAD4KT68_9EURO|nr:mono-functional DNA-alkylating methyl methanesulfonate N-term-domain-containing protein [Talaromyces proteolyticus]KAH8700452.1 mono-functional DNA-alkylating methyl methanesulfonate N-term-domain-containing protein [Talaromyces proteolyticus]
MSLQIFHTEDGFLPLQYPGISEAMRRGVARYQKPVEPSESNKPKVGLLTQTITPSPTIQFVLPARLRSKLQNDVVFVGERSLLLREIVMDSYLEDVSVKSDFDANIMAVKALKVFHDTPLNVETELVAQIGSLEEIQPAEEFPTDLLVLTLDSKELIFLYYHWNFERQTGHFVQFRRALPCDVSITERFGRHLAVDPRSRAIAIAAPGNFFGVFLLKSPAELQSQMKNKTLDPIREERFFRIDGDIIFMDFLYPESENDNKIILLFIIAKGIHTLAMCYEWKSANTLRQARPRIVMKKLPESCRLPSLLIPLTKSTSFIVVATTFFMKYTHFTSPKNTSSRHLINAVSTKLPMLWTKWARPYRHQTYSKSHDDIYLCREDGLLWYFSFTAGGEIEALNSCGWLGCDVDGAFDTIDFSDPNHGGDLLLAAGHTGHGGLFIQTARQDSACVQRFVNWAPILDSALVPSTSNKLRKGLGPVGHTSDSDHLYVCSASSNEGAVYEFRYGYEAQIGWIIPLDDLSSTRYIWCMPDISDEGTYLLVSDPITSTLLYIPRKDGGEINAVDDLNSALDYAAQTIAAGYTPDGILVQITSNSVRLTVPGNTTFNLVEIVGADQTILNSVVNGRLALLAMAVKSDQGIKMQIGKISLKEGTLVIDNVGELGIKDEPTSILIEIVNDEIFLFLGSGEGRIDCYELHQREVLFLGGFTLSLTGDDLLKVIESMSIVTWQDADNTFLLCGLRSGLLVPVGITLDTESLETSFDSKQYPEHRLGQTVVKLSRKDKTVVATCGSGFWCISNINADTLDFDLQQIWITDQNNPAYAQKSVDVFTVIDRPTESSSTTLDGSLVCISDGQLLICALDRFAKAIPRKIDLPGSANRITYSEHLQSLVVAYNITETVESETGPVKRYTRPYLEFIYLDSHNSNLLSSQSSQQDGDPNLWRPSGSSGEKITCILDWMPENNGRKYHFIVIGTARNTKEDKGRIIFLIAKRSKTNPTQVECSVKHIHPFDGPVRAVAAYGDFTLMVASGNDIIPIEPDLPDKEKQWATSARFKLTSPGISITVRKTFLYVSTARESLVVLQVVNNKLELHAQDGARHEGLSHYRIGGPSKLILSSRRGGTLSLFSETKITNTNKLLSPAIAEANLPVSIIRLNPYTKPSILPSSTAVYGTAMDGTIYRIMTINENEWRLLRFVQNLCSRDPIVSPFLSSRKSRWTWRDIIPQFKTPSQMHVDGDILSRLLPYGSSHLRAMLDADSRSFQVDASIPLPETTCMGLFEEYFGEVFGETSLHDDDDDDAVSHFIHWLRKVLRSF